MRLSKRFVSSAGVALIALGTVAVAQIRPQMKKTQESIRDIVGEAPVEVQAGLIEEMDNVDDRGEPMPGRVLDNILDLVADPSEPGETEQETTEHVDSRGGDLPRGVLEDALGDRADLPDPPNASDDDQVSSGSTPREPSPLVPEGLHNNSDRYVPPNGNEPSDTVDRILDDSSRRDLLDGILGPTGRSQNPGCHV